MGGDFSNSEGSWEGTSVTVRVVGRGGGDFSNSEGTREGGDFSNRVGSWEGGGERTSAMVRAVGRGEGTKWIIRLTLCSVPYTLPLLHVLLCRSCDLVPPQVMVLGESPSMEECSKV